MREFVVIGHEVPTDASFSLDDLAGGAGRLDLLARCVSAGLFTSHGIRDARVWLVCRDEYTVRFDGETARNLHPDERSTAARVRSALDRREAAIGHEPVSISDGVALFGFGLEPTLRATDGPLVWLHEDGQPAVDGPVPDEPTVVVSDHRSFTDAEHQLLAEAADRRIAVGPEAIHADHAISVTHNWLDTDGYSRY